MKRITILFVFLVVSQFVYGQSEYLDKTFGDNGVVITRQADVNEFGIDVVVLPDQSILQIGCTLPNSTEYELVITHLTPDGHVDGAFGNNGRYAYPSLSSSTMYLSKGQPYPDGRMLIFGLVTTNSYTAEPFVARILANGDLDKSFGVNGIYKEVDNLPAGQFVSLITREDGSIIALGYRGDTSDSWPTITLITDKGERDTSFGVDGRVDVTIPYNMLSVNDAYIDKHGKCVFGASPLKPAPFDVCVIRTDLNGTLDQSFGVNGVATSSLSDNIDPLISIREMSDEKIVCMTSIRSAPLPNIKLVQFTADGRVDTDFGDWGSTQIQEENPNCSGYDCVIDRNDKIVIAGSTFNDSIGSYTPEVFHILPDGVPDSSFGTIGDELNSDFKYGEVRAIDIQSDGKCVVTGWIFDAPHSYYSNVTYRINSTLNRIYQDDELNRPCISVHPTPSADNCTVKCTLPSSSNCTMTLRDESGREVRTFITNQYRTAGEYKEELDLRGLSAGVYFFLVESNGAIQTAKLIKQ
jgi:uncharacterized delta-60 repeat protein